MVNKIDELINLLERDKTRNINILNFILMNPVLSVEIVGNSVLVRGKSDQLWVYISSASQDELKLLTERLDISDNHFAAIEDWMIPILSSDRDIEWDLSMNQFILPEDAKLASADNEIRGLTLDDAVHVYENSDYKDFISLDYVRSRIHNGPSAAIHEGNKLVAWAMTQDDGAIGFLHVLENFRGKGYGSKAMIELIGKLRRNKMTPFAYIEEDNPEAAGLISKLGFRRDKKVHWLKLG